VLPLVIDEQQVFSFKFWFGNQIQNGMHFQNELFCQIGVVDSSQRSQLYQHACKLSQHGLTLVLTCSQKHCRVWGSLRDEAIKQLLINPDPVSPTNLIYDCAAPSKFWEPES
jgi:hypothetical protein